MDISNTNYQQLIQKLDSFIRKYYLNQLIRGVLYASGLLLAFFLLANLLEYQFYFSTSVRKILFWGFILTMLASVGYWILLPLMHYFRLGKIISHEQAANIIGKYFGNVKDKLLNILQLKQQSDQQQSDLLLASIDQKIDNIKLVPFKSAIDLSKNKKYAKYALIPLFVLAAILFAAPNIIRSGTERIINNERVYEREAPFMFSIENESLQTLQNENFTVKINAQGDILPAEAFIHVNNFPYKLKKIDDSHFEYTFNKVQKNIDFFVESGGFNSDSYTLEVLPRPMLLNFTAEIDYPAYTELKDQTLRNSGDIQVPAGTKITWNFEAEHTDELLFRIKGKEKQTTKRMGENQFSFSEKLLKDSPYSIFVANKNVKNADSISYMISVTPDLHPSISVQQIADSLDNQQLYFLGEAADDYGIAKIEFKYQIEHEKNLGALQTFAVAREGTNKNATFTYDWNLKHLNLTPGDKLIYFFEVWDNDAVNGSKYTRSSTMTFQLPDLNQLDELVDKQNEQIHDNLQEAIDKAEELREEMKDIKEKLVQKKDLNWEDREQIEKMLNEHQQLQEAVENIQDNFQENQQKEESFKNLSEEMKEKKEKLQEMMDQMMSEEMKEMLEKLKDEMEEISNEELMEKLKDMELNDEQLQREMERLKDLMKELEMEQKIEETAEKLEQLAEEQEKLSEETEQNNTGNLDKQQEKQEELNKEFDEIQKDLEEIKETQEELNKDTEEMEQNQEDAEDIEQDMEQSMDEMEQSQNQPASKSQQSASQKMKKMAGNMKSQLQEMKQKQGGEDMQAIRQLLENLITMSFDQERVMNDISATTVNNPNYNSLVQEQYKLYDDFQIIEDSLNALSKRVFQIQSFVLKELTEVKQNFGTTLENLGDRKVPPALVSQQYIMTGLNNLALMLSEALQQMQQQMMAMMPGSGSCNNPGGMGKGLSEMKKMQQQLNQQMQQMMEKMAGEQGEQGKSGKKGEKGEGMSKEIAQAAARQAAIRNALRELNDKENKDGKGSLGDLDKLMEEMEKTEEDLVNKRISQEMIKRQQDILTRLLEAEEAERQREMDNKRQSETATDKPKKLPPAIEEYLKKRRTETELYHTVPPDLKPYYKNLVEDYFKTINN
ncbi:MAG: DUF4175 family protein [Chitinophagales bacterium]|nr:DUF4175 family protein [Bacteroidota bacterium]MCB9043895.1 DUF4175 family protein [Chitinophagales bacterium]